MTKVLVLDFDGVIVPSEAIKVEGYARIFSEYGEPVPQGAIESARDEFSAARGNRFDIIRGILRQGGHNGDLDTAVQEYARRYSVDVQHRIESLAVEPAVREFLERISKKIPIYVNSNNPDDSLASTLGALGIRDFFKGIFGSSKSKLDNLRSIAERENVAPQEILFIGDGEGDRKAAADFGCEFIGVATDMNGWVDTEPFPTIRSLAELTGLRFAVV